MSDDLVSMRSTFGDCSNAPPVVSRELRELQRACNVIVAAVRKGVAEHLWINAEADIAPNICRLVIHYADSPRLVRHLMKTVELDLHPGLPLDNGDWLREQAGRLVAIIQAGRSHLVIPRELDYLRLTDNHGHTVYEQGKAIEAVGKKP